MPRRTPALVLAVALTVAACGNEKADTCEELADQTIVLMQNMIDELEEEMGDLSMEEVLATGLDDLPSLDRFQERAADVDARAEELGCTPDDIEALIQSRVGELEATAPIGELIIDSIRSGGL